MDFAPREVMSPSGSRAAAHFLGLCPPEVTALLPGGSLVLSLDTASGHIRMTGPAVTVFEGEWPGG